MTGLGTSLRLAWRPSRVFWTVWVLGLASLMPLTVTKYHELVPEGQDATAMLTALGADPTMRAILGVPGDLSTPGGFSFWRVGTFTAAAAGMMAALGVIRATRAEEEDGRHELLRSGAVARHAPLAAGVLLSLLGCLATALATAAGMAAGGTPLAGSLLSGLSIGATGAMFVGLGAVAAQVWASARTGRAWTLGLGLGGLYLARAVLDAGPDTATAARLRWVNPLE